MIPYEVQLQFRFPHHQLPTGPKTTVLRNFHVSWSGPGVGGTRSIGFKMGRGGRLDTRCS